MSNFKITIITPVKNDYKNIEKTINTDESLIQDLKYQSIVVNPIYNI